MISLVYTLRCVHCSRVLTSEPNSTATPSHEVEGIPGHECPGAQQAGVTLDRRVLSSSNGCRTVEDVEEQKGLARIVRDPSRG